MSGVTGLYGVQTAETANQAAKTTQTTKAETTEAAQAGAAQEQKKVQVSGKTIGSPKLTEKAAKYYEELKKKNPNMEFILVSADQKEAAKARAASYANPNKMVVLIDEEKIERMATDEKFRQQYETIIKNGASSLSQMAQKLEASGVKVKGFGMEVKDGRASFFAAVDKSFSDMRVRQQKRAAEKKAAKKAEAKKAEKKAAEERLRKRGEKTEKTAKGIKDEDGIRKDSRSEIDDERWDPEDVEMISASSIEELMQKLEDYNFAYRSDHVQTEVEKRLGQNVDFSV